MVWKGMRGVRRVETVESGVREITLLNTYLTNTINLQRKDALLQIPARIQYYIIIVGMMANQHIMTDSNFHEK